MKKTWHLGLILFALILPASSVLHAENPDKYPTNGPLTAIDSAPTPKPDTLLDSALTPEAVVRPLIKKAVAVLPVSNTKN